MLLLQYALTFAMCCVLLGPAEAWFWGGRRKVVPKVVTKKIGKAICKNVFEFVCPVAVAAGGAVAAVGSGGVGAAAAAAGVAIGTKGCNVAKDKCKRSVPVAMVIVPFSDKFSDYDTNGDKNIGYEEFAFSIMSTVNLTDSSQLMEPFVFADLDGDRMLDTQEFVMAPFLFAHPIYDLSKNGDNTLTL